MLHLDKRLFSIQIAIMETLLKEHPDLKNQIEERARYYEDLFLFDGAEVMPAVEGAINHMLDNS
jgi:hypothetical protein